MSLISGVLLFVQLLFPGLWSAFLEYIVDSVEVS
jgi:hypothetical protein